MLVSLLVAFGLAFGITAAGGVVAFVAYVTYMRWARR